MHAIVTICFAVMATHLVGSAVLFGILSGSQSVLAFPLLSIFGWFFMPLEMLVVAAQWALLADVRFKRVITAWLLTVPGSALLMAIIAPKIEDDYFRWATAYGIGTAVALSLGLVIIAASKSIRIATPDTSIRGELCD